MTQLTENDIKPVPQFVDANPTASELNALAEAVHALQRVVAFQHQEITRLTAEADKAPAKRATSTKTTSK